MARKAREERFDAASVQTTNRIVGNARWWALAAVLLTMFFASMDQTVVSTALPVIIGDLHGFKDYAWVFTAYMMASAITVPIYGKLSDIWGRKPFYILGLGIFMVGSALSGQAHSMMELILFRAVQGIGAGAMMSMPRATIGDIFNPRERGRWMGVISMVFGLASIIGPFLGGWITDQMGWRWVFYINLPVAALALVMILATLPTVRAPHRVQVDWTGSAVLVAVLVPMLLGFTLGGSAHPWGSPTIIGLFALSAAAIVAFIVVESRAVEPVIPLHFFKVPVFATTNLIALLITIGMFGAMMFLPVYIQGVLHMSAQNSGAVMTPMMLSFIIGAMIAGQLMTRTGRYKEIAVVGAVFMCVGLFLLTRLTVFVTWTRVVEDLLVMGLGIGALMPTLNLAVQNAFPYKNMGMVSASQQFVRSLAGVIASPILGAVLADSVSAHLKRSLPSGIAAMMNHLPKAQRTALANPQNLINAQAQAAIQKSFEAYGSQGAALYHQFIAAVRGALAAGMSKVFLIALVFALVALVVTFLLPSMVLKRDEFYEEETGTRSG